MSMTPSDIARLHELASATELSTSDIADIRRLYDYTRASLWPMSAHYLLADVLTNHADSLLTSIESADRARQEAHDAAIEMAAQWHDEQDRGGHCGESTTDAILRQRRNEWHRESATAIRSLKLSTSGKEGT